METRGTAVDRLMGCHGEPGINRPVGRVRLKF